METENKVTIKALANVIAGMVDEDNNSYYADAVYILNAIRSGRIPGVSINTADDKIPAKGGGGGDVSTYPGIVKELAETRALLQAMAEQSAQYMSDRDDARAEIGELNASLGVLDTCQIKPLVDGLTAVNRQAFSLLSETVQLWGVAYMPFGPTDLHRRIESLIAGTPTPTNAVRVKLPPRRNANTFTSPESRYEDDGYDRAIEECAEALKAQGVEVEE